MLCAIPIEICNRELDGIIYLALHLAKKGMPTLLGERMVHEYIFRINANEPVIYFDSDFSPTVGKKVISTGGVVFNLSAEGLVKKEWKGLPIYRNISDSVTTICAWGEETADVIKTALPEDKTSLVEVTGYPSFDLMFDKFSPYYISEKIVAEHGDNYLMVNTNFARFNLKMSLDKYLKMLGKMDEWKLYNTPEMQKGIMEEWNNQKNLFSEFKQLVQALSREFPDRHIVVRPHPMEGLQLYKDCFKDLPNVFVTNDSPVRHWISSAGAVIHHDCTTGAEALAMNKLVIGYRPIFNKKKTCRIMSKIGVHATTTKEVIQAVHAGTMPEEQRLLQLEALHPFFANFGQTAAEHIASLAATHAEPTKVWLPKPLNLFENIKCWRKHVSKILRSYQPGHNGRKVRYALDKFPRLPFAEIENRVTRLQAIEPDLPPVEVTSLALNTFLIAPK